MGGGLMIASCKGRVSFTNALFSNLNTINLKVFPKHGGISKILEVNSLEVSNGVSCTVSHMLTLTWGIDILFEKLPPEIRVEFEKQPLHTTLLRVGISCKACLLF